MNDKGPLTVYAVVFSNYYPAEVDSLWRRRGDAEARAEELNASSDTRGWDVSEWDVEGARSDVVDGVVDRPEREART